MNSVHGTLAVFGLPGGPEVLVILLVGLLLFGGRLPEVGRSLGRSLVEFRKGLRGLKDEVGIDREIQDIRRDLRDAAREDTTKQWPEPDRSAWNEIEFDDKPDGAKPEGASPEASASSETIEPRAKGKNAAGEIIDTEIEASTTGSEI
ncbi:MAG: twin-arginine translocase TatA/TatE family subunit, partial [Planctomycetes bacterium]|nr:twin-arginine translocase TatA/TatE family subunit [Planctomycetota bacterium]